MHEGIPLPATVPIMPLSGALLFPHALLPLYIFEPRYQAMLEYALQEERMFSVALVRPKHTDWRTPADFFPTAGVGLIRACVGRGDGTSNLILQGLRRVRFTGFEQEHPFPIAKIEPLATANSESPQVHALGLKVLDLYRGLRESGRKFPEKVDDYLSDLTDPEMLADLMAATFITEPLRRQQLLEELNLARRLQLVVQFLGEEAGNAAA